MNAKKWKEKIKKWKWLWLKQMMLSCAPSSINHQLKKMKNQVSFTDDVKLKITHTDLLPTMEAGVMCTIDRETFFTFMKNKWTIQVPFVISLTMTKAYITSLISMIWQRANQAVYLLQKRKPMNESKASGWKWKNIHHGPWNIALRPVQMSSCKVAKL